MSWATSYTSSNNIHFDYPPLMSDQRFFTSWNTSTNLNEQIKKDENITSNYDYRQYLINNAEKIMKINKDAACNNCCACNVTGNEKLQEEKYIFKSCSDDTKPFGYETSDLKKVYLTRQELESRKSAPILNQHNTLKFE